MAIVESQLLASLVLQQNLVDKDTGEPLVAGVIDLYKDNNRLERKNWYYKTGTPPPGEYTYAALANPLVLSGSGTIVDPSGNEITPYYYPFSETSSADEELYYIEVYNSAGTLQFRKEGWPPLDTGSAVGESPTLQNLIVNNQFWRSLGILGGGKIGQDGLYETSVDLTNKTDLILAPSKHDGFHQPDFRFLKDVTGATDTVTFKRFINGDDPFIDDITPQFYINIKCTASVTTEQIKLFQFPIALNIRNLEAEKAIFTIQARNTAGNPNGKIIVRILKFLGSSTAPNANGTIIGSQINLTNRWKKHPINFTFGSLDSGDVIKNTHDDAYYLQIEVPLNTTFNFDIAVPSIYLGVTAATNYFESYDKIDSVINTPRTGDYRQSLNGFQPYGWVPSNNSTIGQNTSAADFQTSETWPLYKLIWDNVADIFAPASGGRGGLTALAGFNGGKTLTLTKNLGRVLVGANPVFDEIITFTLNITTTVCASIDLAADTMTFADVGDLTTGDVLQLATTGTLPPPLVAATDYYVGITGNIVTFYNSLYNALNDIDKIDLITGGTAAANHSIVNTDLSLTMATAPDSTLAAGTPVVFTTDNIIPAGLNESDVYFISSRSTSTTKYKLSATYERATDTPSVCINFQDSGTGIHSVQNALGASIGESRHVQALSELATHDHGYQHVQGNPTPTFADFSAGGAGAKYLVDQITTKTGDNVAMNNMQLSTFVNVFIKL